MERITKGEVITLDDNEEYYVIEIVEEGEEHYLYLVSANNGEKVMVAKEVIEGDELFVETLDDQEKIKEIVEIVLKRLKNI